MLTTAEPVAKAQLTIRKPVNEVFEAFVNPDVTTQFCSPKAVEDWNLASRFDGVGKCITLMHMYK
jgi:uncharacterized protein YndB with AHSA1/START domain